MCVWGGVFIFSSNAFSYAHIQNALVNVFIEMHIYSFISSVCNILSNCDFFLILPPTEVNAFFVHLYFISILFTILLDSQFVPAVGGSPTSVFTMGLQQAKNKTPGTMPNYRRTSTKSMRKGLSSSPLSKR